MLSEPLLQHPTPETATDESDQEQEERYINEEQGEEEEEVQRFDVKDRVDQHPLKNRRLKVLLYQEWHIGKITWYKVLEEYKVEFNDGTDILYHSFLLLNIFLALYH